MRDLDEARAARDAALNSAKETERKLKSLEAENMQLHEVHLSYTFVSVVSCFIRPHKSVLYNQKSSGE